MTDSLLPSAHLSLRNITLLRGRTQVFEGLNLTLAEPRIGVIGDNGTGKSSLFRLLCGLEFPQAGEALLDGQSLHVQPGRSKNGKASHWQARVGMMFQNPDDQIIFPTVEEELGLSLTAQGVARKAAQAQARDFLAQRGLADWAERAVGSLSQGQRQYVCWLALALAAPRVLLLDEPFASLDLHGQSLLWDEIAAAPQQVLLSTHVLQHVRHFGRVIWLEKGRVRADGAGTEICAAYEAHVAESVALRRAQAPQLAAAHAWRQA